MPYFSPWTGSTEAANQLGSDLSRLLYQRQMANVQQRQWEQELAFRRQQQADELAIARARMQQQGEQFQLGMPLQNAQTRNLLAEALTRENAEKRTQSTYADAGQTGKAAMLQSLLQTFGNEGVPTGSGYLNTGSAGFTPDMARENAILKSRVLLNQTGAVPLSMQEIDPAALRSALGAVIRGNLTGIAAATPGSAERMIQEPILRPGSRAWLPTGEERVGSPALTRGRQTTVAGPGSWVLDQNGNVVQQVPMKPANDNQVHGHILAFAAKLLEANPNLRPEEAVKQAARAWAGIKGGGLGEAIGEE